MSTKTVSDLTAEIERRKQELAKLETQLEVLKTEPEDVQLARQLHGMLCQWNHTDGCGWFYEFKDDQDVWTGHAHSNYLTKARKLIHQCKAKKISPQDAIGIFKMVKE